MTIKSWGPIISLLLPLLVAAADNRGATPSAGASDAKTTEAKAMDKGANDSAPLSKKEEKRRQQSLQKELNKPFQRWLDEDVVYRSQNLGIYLQVYNLATDEKSHKPSATVEYSLLKGGAPLAHWTKTGDQLKAAGQQITVEKIMTLKQLAPGSYRLQVKVTDQIARQTITPTASFTVQ